MQATLPATAGHYHARVLIADAEPLRLSVRSVQEDRVGSGAATGLVQRGDCNTGAPFGLFANARVLVSWSHSHWPWQFAIPASTGLDTTAAGSEAC